MSLDPAQSSTRILPKTAATIVTSILAFSSPSLAASDEEIAHSGDLMSGAFKCATYAGMFHDQKEQARLFQIGLKAARDFVEGMKSRNDSPWKELPMYMPGASTDFVVGTMYASEYKDAYNEVVKYLRRGRAQTRS
jgi:hypothetical protein